VSWKERYASPAAAPPCPAGPGPRAAAAVLGGTGTVRQEITALPRTVRNIAKANVTVPAGFRQVPDGTFGGPVSGWFNSG